MSAAKIYQSILNISASYENTLKAIDESAFQLTPPIGGWSYSEVYCHIFDSSLLSVEAINNCIKGEGQVRPTAFLVKVILFIGMLPPGRKYKVPSKIAGRVKKIDIAAAHRFINDFNSQLIATKDRLKKADPKIKAKHPVLGYLNAAQWLKFTEIHLKHHLKQLDGIRNSFR